MLATLEFTRDRKSMSVLHEAGNKKTLYIKGAPDYLIAKSSKIMSKTGEILPLSS